MEEAGEDLYEASNLIRILSYSVLLPKPNSYPSSTSDFMDPTSTSNTTDVPIQLPPALAAYIDGIRPAMYILIFCAVWLGVAIPLLIILFYTSSRALRRSAVFISNVIGISLAISFGVLGVAMEVSGINI